MPKIHFLLLSSQLVDTGLVNFVFTLFQLLKLEIFSQQSYNYQNVIR